MRPPKVSILIPTYNHAHFIEEAIQSVLLQEFTDFELIIVDNNSSDDTEAVVQKYLSHPKIVYHRNQINIGMAGNFNQCLSQAKGKYIKFLNSDDKFHPKLLSRFVSVMEEHPEVTLVTCVQELFGEIHFTLDMPYFGLQKGAKVIQDTLKTYNWIGAPSSVMFRRSPHHFRTDLSWILDWEMWIRQLLEGDCFIVSERLTFIRAHANQATTILRENCLARFEEYQLYSDIYAGQKLEIDQEILYRLVKSKAKNCAVVAFKKILKINKKAHMEIFLRALRIAIKEQVLYSTLSEKFYMLLAPHIPRPIRAVPAIYKKYYSTATRKRKTSYKPKQDAQFLISNNIDKLQA